jgi:hypothetical protein
MNSKKHKKSKNRQNLKAFALFCTFLPLKVFVFKCIDLNKVSRHQG